MNRTTLLASAGYCSHPTLLALCISTALTVFTPAILAEETTTTVNAELRTYNIPAQPLSEALIQFGKQSGLQVTVDGSLVGTEQAPSVSGAMTTRQALTHLLANSGLTYTITDTMASIEVEGEATVLPPIQISDSAIKAGNYSSSHTPVTGNRFNQELIEIPRAVSIVTRNVIEDQQTTSEAEVLRNVSGVNQTNDYNGIYNRFILRGIAADNQRSYLRNGYHFLHLSDPAWYNIEQVEVIKGPNAIDYGQSTPGGFVNYVTKKPLDQASQSVELTAGSYDLKRGSVDLTGPLNNDKTLLYRLTAGYEEDGNFIDHVDPEQGGLTGSLSWLVTPNTTLNLATEYQRTTQLSNPWVPVPDPSRLDSVDALSIHNFYGDRSAETDIKETRYSAELLHDLSDDWRFRATYAQDELVRDNHYTQLRGLTDDGTETTRRLWRRLDHDNDSKTARIDLRGNFTVLDTEHDIIIGGDYYEFKTSAPAWNLTDLAPISVFNPTLTHTLLPAFEPDPVSKDKSTARGFFVQDNIELGSDWGVQLGLRRDTLKNESASEETSQTSPNAAVTFAPDEDSLIYLSHSTSFEPNWGADLIGGGVADPSEGKQFEVGVKQNWFDNRITTTAALFELRKTNIVVGDPDNPEFSVLTGEAKVRGIELEAIGELLPGLNIISQLTLLDAEITADTNTAVIGNQLSGSVEETGSIWASYQLPGDLHRWRVGGGIFYTGDRAIDDENTLELPGYTTIDAFVAYQLSPKTEIRLNAKNITDKRYYVSASGGDSEFGAVNVGEPRAVSLTLNITF